MQLFLKFSDLLQIIKLFFEKFNTNFASFYSKTLGSSGYYLRAPITQIVQMNAYLLWWDHLDRNGQ